MDLVTQSPGWLSVHDHCGKCVGHWISVGANPLLIVADPAVGGDPKSSSGHLRRRAVRWAITSCHSRTNHKILQNGMTFRWRPDVRGRRAGGGLTFGVHAQRMACS